mmetsp:Transcript_44915/g.74531  ORF Transcript_44915/g.74531 Transcript_44915/m.74531 type:complete len:105 (+) Transcript_44915:29-343(+)
MNTLNPGLDDRTLAQAFRSVDDDGSGSLDLEEFLRAQPQLRTWKQKRKPRQAGTRRGGSGGRRAEGGGRKLASNSHSSVARPAWVVGDPRNVEIQRLGYRDSVL